MERTFHQRNWRLLAASASEMAKEPMIARNGAPFFRITPLDGDNREYMIQKPRWPAIRERKLQAPVDSAVAELDAFTR